MSSLPIISAGSCDHIGNQWVLLKLIQFANRSTLENAGSISSQPKLVFKLLQSSQEVFCSHGQVLFLQSSANCNRNGKYFNANTKLRVTWLVQSPDV